MYPLRMQGYGHCSIAMNYKITFRSVQGNAPNGIGGILAFLPCDKPHSGLSELEVPDWHFLVSKAPCASGR